MRSVLRKFEVIILFSSLVRWNASPRNVAAFQISAPTYRYRSIPVSLSYTSTGTTNPSRTALYQRHQNREFHKTSTSKMPRGVKKENLPSKICVTCGRPFNWRKKWERVWDEVTTCSKSCNRKRREANQQALHKEKSSTTSISYTTSSVVGGGDTDSEDVFYERSRPVEQVGENPRFVSDHLTTNHETYSDSAVSPIEQEQQEDTCVSIEEEEVLLVLSQQRPDSETMNQLLNGDDSDSELETETDLPLDPEARKKAIRKAEKKAKKEARRAQREGRGDPTAGQKECSMCGKSSNLLVRCMYKKGQVDWEMVCGKCWNVASGGIVDGDAEHPHYRYGGLWKNRRAQI
jgi:hypothetical protein